jgi:hypothetical protein
MIFRHEARDFFGASMVDSRYEGAGDRGWYWERHDRKASSINKGINSA